MTERVSPRNPDVSSSIDPAYIKAELLRVNPPENRVILAEAIDLAEKAHEGQWREQEGENVPFIVHPLRTAWALAHTGHVSLTTQVKAVLHDTVEDNSKITLAEIKQKFGQVIADGVNRLSKIVEGKYKSIEGYHGALRRGPEEDKRIKVEDRGDNLKAWARRKGDDAKRAKKIIETKENILPLASFDPELRRRLNDAINAVKESFDEDFTIDLKQLLEISGVDIGTWGTNATRSVLDLALEIAARESRLSYGKDGKLQREIKIVAVEVVYKDPETGLEYRLVEDRQEFKDGTKRTRDISFSLAEKLKLKGRGMITGVKRACAEELSLFDIQNSQITLGDTSISTGVSRGYPGLRTRYVIHQARVNLNREQFRPDGYIEEQPDKTTYFRWEAVVKNRERNEKA
ncbi:MAG: HD domain-containing protein [Patescibacteria group bacterium]|nr:HD domain-containing protein [Patescibacteria group bacterium]